MLYYHIITNLNCTYCSGGCFLSCDFVYPDFVYCLHFTPWLRLLSVTLDIQCLIFWPRLLSIPWRRISRGIRGQLMNCRHIVCWHKINTYLLITMSLHELRLSIWSHLLEYFIICYKIAWLCVIFRPHTGALYISIRHMYQVKGMLFLIWFLWHNKWEMTFLISWITLDPNLFIIPTMTCDEFIFLKKRIQPINQSGIEKKIC